MSSPIFYGDDMARSNDVSKYNVNKDVAKRTFDGITFASVLEMRFYQEVVLPLTESGVIKSFELQKEYILQPSFIRDDGRKVKAITYVADFYIEYADGRVEVVDTKGCADSLAKLKRKMFWYVYPELKYVWKSYSKVDGGWVDYDFIQQQRRARKKLKEEKEEKLSS